jgi:NhaP-type Na+/H+ or K+/H+ antiporter
MEQKSPHEKNLFKVITFASGVSLGALGAIIGSMKDFFHGDAALSFSWRTIVGFVLGFIVGWLPWRWIGRRISKSE